jgi:hypothetical protein
MARMTLDLNQAVWQRLARSAAQNGYDSPEAYAKRLLEERFAAAPAEAAKDIQARMEELGYLDFGSNI